MPTTTVEILQMPCSYSSGEYPLLSSASQSLSGYVKATYTGFKIRDDLRQQIRVPAFTGWSDCNMVRADGRLYWILDATTASGSEHSVDMVISYCGPSSVLHKGDQIAGTFSRLPTNKCPWLQRQPKSGGLSISRRVSLPKLPDVTMDNDVKMQMFWVQVTTSNDITQSGSAANSDLQRYGFFTAFTSRFVGGIVLYTGKTFVDPHFPDLDDFLSNPESYGFTASAITDVSISARCPYAYTSATSTLEGVSYFTANLDDLDPISAGTAIIYDLQPTGTAYPEIVTASLSVTRSDLERGTGTITIRDECSNNLGVIDPAWDTVTIKASCVPDYGSMTTYLDVNGYLFALSEGHIPWVGDAWEEYKKYSLAYDREAMEQSINFANQRVAVNIAQSAASTIQSAAMGFIGGDPLGAVAGAIGGVASFGISTWATTRENQISTAENRATQELTERRVQGSAGTAYNTGYGLIYCWQCLTSPACVMVEMPAGLTASIDADYTACFGYPAEGLRSVTIQEGYIKGRIYDNGLARGPKFDRCNESLQNGLLFKEV